MDQTISTASRLTQPRGRVASWSLTLGLAGLAGVLLTAGYALHPLWWASWLAPVPLLIAAGKRQARRAGAVAGALCMASVATYYVDQLGVIATLAIALLRAGGWMLATRLAVLAARRLPLAVAMFALPVVIAATEFLTLTISPHGTAGSLAYSQIAMPVLAQAGAFGGVPAVAFVMLLPGSFLGLMIGRPDVAGAGGVGSRRLAGLVLAAVLTLTAAFSVARLAATPTAGTPVTVIATNRFPDIPRDWDRVWSVYGPAVARASRPGGFVVLPEKIALLTPRQSAVAAEQVSDLAVSARSTIVVGIEVGEGATYAGRALIATPDGRTAWYDKQRLLGGFEDRDTPGRTPFRMAFGPAQVGVAICKDMHIPSIAAAYRGVGLMLVPAWDFDRDGDMGAGMTAFRGIETGYSVVRSARNGQLSVSDPTGRTTAAVRVTGSGLTILQSRVSLDQMWTPYLWFQGVWGWSCVAAMAALIVGLRLMRRGDDATAPRRAINP